MFRFPVWIVYEKLESQQTKRCGSSLYLYYDITRTTGQLSSTFDGIISHHHNFYRVLLQERRSYRVLVPGTWCMHMEIHNF